MQKSLQLRETPAKIGSNMKRNALGKFKWRLFFLAKHPETVTNTFFLYIKNLLVDFLFRYWKSIKYSRAGRWFQGDEIAIANNVITRFRRNPSGAIALLGLLTHEKITLIPIRLPLHSSPEKYAPTVDEYATWLSKHNIRLVFADYSKKILKENGKRPYLTAKERDALSFLLYTDLRGILMQAQDVILTRDLSRQPELGAAKNFDPATASFQVRRRRAIIELSSTDPDLTPLLLSVESNGVYPGPVSTTAAPPRSPATPRRRSVLFVNPAYYNFYYLAKSLRQRGWDAVAMSSIDPNSAYARQFHGHDWTVFDSDSLAHREKLKKAFRIVANRFDMLHFHGVGAMSMFPDNHDTGVDHDAVPWDVLEMKRRGAKIGYSITGCHDLVTPSVFVGWSPGMCPKCPWRERPEICSDRRMSAWGWKLQQLADLICLETDPPLDFRDTQATFREPLSFAVDPDFWRPGLARETPVPDEWLEPKEPGEILIYHSVGNYELRTRNGVNVKGTGAVIRAIERLRQEGQRVRLLFRKDVPSIHNRWILAQADIIVDQLNYGRYGATAREGLMLGRPVVGRLNRNEPLGLSPVRCIAESPIVDASEETVYDALKRLVENPAEREAIGAASRTHALQWWARDVLAERYERVYDHLQRHGRPPKTLD
jgi:hypothetical protein